MIEHFALMQLDHGSLWWYVVHAVVATGNGALMPRASARFYVSIAVAMCAFSAMWAVTDKQKFQKFSSILAFIMFLLASLFKWPVKIATIVMVSGIYLWEVYEIASKVTKESAFDIMNDLWIGLFGFALACTASAQLPIDNMFFQREQLLYIPGGFAVGAGRWQSWNIGWLLLLHCIVAFVVFFTGGTHWLRLTCNLALFAFGSAMSLARYKCNSPEYNSVS